MSHSSHIYGATTAKTKQLFSLSSRGAAPPEMKCDVALATLGRALLFLTKQVNSMEIIN